MRAGPVICLVGMPGSGKSTVGAIVAECVGARFVDLDVAVRDATGREVSEIFAAEGEQGFRRRELGALEALVDRGEPLVVATGGGIVTTAAARDVLARTTCVWLDATVETLIDRLRDEPPTRPLLAEDLEGSLRRMADERVPLYRSVADHVVPADGEAAATADGVVELLVVAG